MDRLQALIIDNSRHIREFVAEYVLGPHGFDVEFATDGEDGLQKALKIKPDLILLDFEMPRMNGLEVLRSLREKQSKVPVILMTSHGSEQLAVEFFRLGVQDYVRKPFTPDEMLDAIENALTVTYLLREKEALTLRLLETNKHLERSVLELNVLYQIGKSITALMKPDTMLRRLVEAVLSITRSETCTLSITDPETGRQLSEIKRRRDKRTGQLVPVPKAPETNISEPKTVTLALEVGHKKVGTLTVSRPGHAETFTTRDENLLQMLGDYAAIAIYNLQLMHQLQRTKEREKQQIRGMFERYVAPTVVNALLQQPDQVQLGGNRQTVTTLFADMRGFSRFSAQTSPETLVELLNRYLRVAAEAVLEEKGTLDKFMGDAVMAFFNAPLPQADHPLRAVRAAWKLCRAVEEVHRRLPEPYHLSFGVGVSVGEVIVGNIGTPQLMNFTVLGDAVNKAKRLQETAHRGQILLDQQTYHLVQYDIEVDCVGDLRLKGQENPEPIYEVLALRNE